MSRKFLTNLDLGKNQLIAAAVENLGSAPAAPVKGQLYFNSTGGDNTLYWWDGTSWIPAKATGGAFPGYGSVPAETTYGIARNDGAAVTVARSDHTHGTPALPALNALTATADVALSGFKLTGVGTPTAGTDAVTKDYADNLAAGLSWKDAVRAATTVNGTLATAFANGQTIDTVTLATGNRILLKNQTAPAENGIYVVTAGAPTRALDADTATELEEATVFVMEGGQADTAWTNTTNAPITVGTTGLTWVQFGAGTAYTAGAGLSLTGSTFNVGATNGSIVVGADDIGVGYAGTGTTFGTAVTAARSDHNHDTTYAKVIAQDCAANVLTTVTHNFNSRDVKVEVYRNSTPWDTVDVDIERPSVNAVDVRFATAPAAAAFRIVVEGIDL